jgi:hypothetical protein
MRLRIRETTRRFNDCRSGGEEAVHRIKIVATLLVSAILVVGAAALTSVDRYLSGVERRVVFQAATPKKAPAQKSRQNRPTQHIGAWLESHQNLPLDQQEKALENDPNYKKLPPDRQAALRERLRKFNSLTPEQRQVTIKRMNFWASLTPSQRQELRDANQKMQGLPQDRRLAIHKALRHLRQMPPQQRQQVMDSDRFKTLFSEQEQGILKDLASITPPEKPDQQPTPQAAQPPRP